MKSHRYGGIELADAGSHKFFYGTVEFKVSVWTGFMRWIPQTDGYYSERPRLRDLLEMLSVANLVLGNVFPAIIYLVPLNNIAPSVT